jgi:opacity protein-like surface antigen
MRLKLPPELILTAFFVAASVPIHSQVAATGRQGSVPIEVGAALSDFSIDYGPGKRMVGVSVWADWVPDSFPGVLRRMGVEAIGHAIDYDVPAGLSRMRQDTAEVGPIYSWNPYGGFRPYIKYVLGVGSIDFPPSGTYRHDTFFVSSPGAGAEIHAWQHVWIRADYEYQFWHQTFGPHDLTPNGFTIGASYDFRPWVGGSR